VAGASEGPSEARRRAVEARVATLRRDLEVGPHPAQPVRRARQRVFVWSLALIILFAASRPTTARAGGPEARLLRGSATLGGHRLTGAGAIARATPGDVLTVAPDGRMELGVGAGRVNLLGGARLLVERLGPPSLRLLGGDADALGPLVLQTLAGTLRVPAGVEVEVRRAAAGTGASHAGPLVFTVDGPGAELVDARGVHPLR